MRNYESMIVLNPELSDQDKEKENQEIIDLIVKEQGELVKTDTWGKRKLAYDIEKHREGYYIINYFKLPPERLLEIERHYKLSPNIIRYNLLNLD
ncbi:MAG: 30S ribosomal protein S6 [Candidatus Cloacimonetes bacterium]|nr:30S ribosomal protein S6 [Candidatus Cloacimonadota bacterium]